MMRLAVQLRRTTSAAVCAAAGGGRARMMHSAAALTAPSDRSQLRGRGSNDSRSALSASPSSAGSAASAPSSAQGVSRAFLSRLRQLSVSGAASLDAFERALRIMHNEQNPQRAWEVWQILDSAQPAANPSISRRDETAPSAVPAAAVAPASSPLAPTAELYNLAIQSLCVHAKRADRKHAQHALHLFQRMTQLGFHVRMLTYRDLMVALSGCGYPRDSGLEEVFQRCKADARAIKEAGEQHDHPDAAQGAFCVPLVAFESMLFALTASAPRPAKVALWASRVASIVASMERLGVAQSQSTLNSQMMMAVYARDLALVQSLWGQMKALDIYPNRSVLAALIRLYAGQRGMDGDRGGLDAAQLTLSDLQQVLRHIPAMQAVFAAMQTQHKATALPPTPAMIEAKIEALMRAYAVRKAELAATAAQSPPPPSKNRPVSPPSLSPAVPLDPLHLLRDLLHAYSDCERLQYALSKHAYIFVFCALTEIHAAQEAEAERNAAYVRRFDVGQRMRALTTSMARAGVAPLPHMVLFSFQLLASPLTLESDAAHAEMMAHIQQLLRLALHRSFVLQGFLSADEQDVVSLSYRSADHCSLYRQRCTPAVLTQFVCESLVFADCFSAASTFVALPPKEAALARDRRNHKRLTPAQQMMLANEECTKEDESRVTLSVLQPHEGSSNSSSNSDASISAFAPDAPSRLVEGVSDSARLLVAETLRSMLLCLRPRQLSKAARLSPRGVAHLLQLVEAIWEGAGLFGVREQLQAGRAGGLLVHALLTADHPAAETHLDAFLEAVTESATVPAFDDELAGEGAGGNSRARGRARVDGWLVNSAVAIEAVQYLIRRRAPLSSLESLLLRLDQSPSALSKWTFSAPLFYRGVFAAFARLNQGLKVSVYFQRMLHQAHQVDDETIAIVAACVEKSGDRHALEELTLALRQVQRAMQTPGAEAAAQEGVDAASASSSTAAVAESSRRSPRSSSKSARGSSAAPSATAADSRFSWTIGPLSLSVLVRAHVRLDAFAGSQASNGFAASRQGDGTLAAAVAVLEDFSPLAPTAPSPGDSLAVAWRLLKCALLVDDETSARRVLQYLRRHASVSVAVVDAVALDNSWPPVLDCGLEAPLPFLLQMPPTTTQPQHEDSSPSDAAGSEDGEDGPSDHVRLASAGDVGSLLAVLREFARGLADMESATNAVEWQMRAQFDRMATEATRAMAKHATSEEDASAAASSDQQQA